MGIQMMYMVFYNKVRLPLQIYNRLCGSSVPFHKFMLYNWAFFFFFWLSDVIELKMELDNMPRQIFDLKIFH